MMGEELKAKLKAILGLPETGSALRSSMEVEVLLQGRTECFEAKATESFALIREVLILPDPDFELLLLTHSITICYDMIVREHMRETVRKIRSLPVE